MRANSVLLAPGEAGVNELGYPRTWAGPWHGGAHAFRACPMCATDPARGTALVWQLPLTISCGEHGCRLENAIAVRVALNLNELPPPTPVEEPLATLDRYTYAALATGRVDLPGRSVHAGVWFRLLRSLVDEVSVAESTLRMHARTTLEQVWEATGLPYRAGLNTWRPYERLDWEIQQAMLLAAATALHLAAEGEITARGRLASAIQPPRDQYVYDGDQPLPALTAWQEAVIQAEMKMADARSNPDAARQMLAWMTLSCTTMTEFETERAYLFGAGIPASFLPSAAELGRSDLI